MAHRTRHEAEQQARAEAAEAEVRAFRGLAHDTADALDRLAHRGLPPDVVADLNEASMILRRSTGALAALATRPQPLYEGTLIDCFSEDDDDPEANNGLALIVQPDVDLGVAVGSRIVIYPAVAGSATPTQENTDD
jgi:hypothetical protein